MKADVASFLVQPRPRNLCKHPPLYHTPHISKFSPFPPLVFPHRQLDLGSSSRQIQTSTFSAREAMQGKLCKEPANRQILFKEDAVRTYIYSGGGGFFNINGQAIKSIQITPGFLLLLFSFPNTTHEG